MQRIAAVLALVLALAAAAIVLAIMSVAVVSAAPTDKETMGRVSATGEGGATAGASEWVELASATSAVHGKEMIVVDPHSGPYLRLRLEALSGRVVVQRVVVYFADGGKRSVPIKRALERDTPPALVDLERPRSIEQVVVHTDKKSPGTYAVSASPVRPATTPEDP